MIYSEVIQSLSSNILKYFDEVYHDAEIVTTDKEKFPAIAQGTEWINLAPSDQKEIIYIRRDGEDEVIEDMKISSCVKSYAMRSSLRIVFFKDNAKQHGEIITHLLQSVLTQGIKLKRIIRDKWKLKNSESSGEYNFAPDTAYFAIDIYASWYLSPNTCEEDFCAEIQNPLHN